MTENERNDAEKDILKPYTSEGTTARATQDTDSIKMSTKKNPIESFAEQCGKIYLAAKLIILNMF